MNPVQMFKLLGNYNKAKSIAKENVSLNTKISQYLVLAGTVAGLFGAWSTGWLNSHAGAFTILVGIANVLAHLFPSIFATPSAALEQKAGLANGKLPLILLALFAAAISVQAQTAAAPPATATTTTLPASFYAAGASYNPGASPSYATTLLLAKAVTVAGTSQLAFTVVDVLPVNLKTLTVSTNIGIGDAVKLATIAGHTVYAPTSAGISYTGSNTGWNWTTGVAVPVKIRADKSWYAVPNVRVLKSSVSGYQLVPGVLFGWGQ